MKTLEEIERAIRQLSHDELAQFRRWFAEYDAEIWDRQMELDVEAGCLDVLAQEALADRGDGRCTDLCNGDG
jgi:hypothetical protein